MRARQEMVADLRTYSTGDIASIYGLKEPYLRKLRQLNKGPKYMKLGRMIRYRKEDVENWFTKAMVEVTPKGVV